MADALVSGTSESNLLQVQILLTAPLLQSSLYNCFAKAKLILRLIASLPFKGASCLCKNLIF